MTPAALSILMVYLKRIKEAKVSSQAVVEKDN
jgi:hypothetical protein